MVEIFPTFNLTVTCFLILSFSTIIFFSRLGIFIWILVSFYFSSFCSSLIQPFKKGETKELLMGHSQCQDMFFEVAFGIHNLQC